MIFWSILLFLALFSFDANDPSFNLVRSGDVTVQNKVGLFGAYAAGFLDDIFGIGSLVWPTLFACMGIACIRPSFIIQWWRWLGYFLLTLCLMVACSSTDFRLGDLSGGGMLGSTLSLNSNRYLSPAGSFLVWLFVFIIGVQLACNFSWISQLNRFYAFLASWLEARKGKKFSFALPKPENLRNLLQGLPTTLPRPDFAALLALLDKWRKRPAQPMPEIRAADSGCNSPDPFILEDKQSDDFFAPAEDIQLETQPMEPPVQPQIPQNVIAPLPIPYPPARLPTIEKDSQPKDPSYVQSHQASQEAPLPSPSLLLPPQGSVSQSEEELQARGQALMTCFSDFDIQGELVKITPGPVVTMFQVRPGTGVRVSKIANLSDDLSLALKAVAVRIQAPIPGSDTVGIEIPNDRRETVNFRELVESGSFAKGCGPLTMILGKDIAGSPYMADLAKMPHLLVAGATGAGKSVCLNSILVSLVYRVRPSDLRLLLIDPKRIEMSVYSDLPHLIHPVVTEMSDAKNALDWAVHEMEERYRTLGLLGVRNVTAYNHKLASFNGNPPPAFAELKPYPYLVIVIDELADLMMTASREVETSIVRLAQLARAAGIHMILATQRPSVDVVTGLIKANFPSRISFQVTSKHDSRIILDQVGAEHLLGRGDMLYKPSAGALQRLHGPFLSDEEVQAVVNYWKENHEKPEFDVDFSNWSSDTGSGPQVGGDASNDPLYKDASAFVLEQGRVSISLLQRHLRIGFNRAACLVEQLERDGIIGPADGSKPRTVIK